jgi:hypothetical protein
MSGEIALEEQFVPPQLGEGITRSGNAQAMMQTSSRLSLELALPVHLRPRGLRGI